MNKIKFHYIHILSICLPLAILLYNYIALTIGLRSLSGYFISLLFLLIVSVYLFVVSKNLIPQGMDYRLLLFFALLCIPAYIQTRFTDIYSYIRTACAILFFPMCIMIGKMFGHYVNIQHKNVVIVSLILIPLFFTFLLLVNIKEYLLVFNYGRDAIFCSTIFLPLIFLYKSKKIQIPLLLFMLYLAFESSKRTAIICASVSFLFFLIAYYRNLRKDFFKIFISGFILISGMFYAYNNIPILKLQVDNSLLRFENLEEDNSSNERKDMYILTYKEFKESSLFNQMFGHGCNAVSIELFGHPAHNDILELLYDYGVIPLLSYMAFLICILYSSIKKKKPIMFFSVVNYLILSMMNCMITNPIFVYVNIFTLGITSVYNSPSNNLYE